MLSCCINLLRFHYFTNCFCSQDKAYYLPIQHQPDQPETINVTCRTDECTSEEIQVPSNSIFASESDCLSSQAFYTPCGTYANNGTSYTCAADQDGGCTDEEFQFVENEWEYFLIFEFLNILNFANEDGWIKRLVMNVPPLILPTTMECLSYVIFAFLMKKPAQITQIPPLSFGTELPAAHSLSLVQPIPLLPFL